MTASVIRQAEAKYASRPDAWVADGAPASGLGRRLLVAAARASERIRGAGFMKLSVYDDNGDARAAYLRMGFMAHEAATNLSLDAAGLKRLRTG